MQTTIQRMDDSSLSVHNCCKEQSVFKIRYEDENGYMLVCEKHWNAKDENGYKYFQKYIASKEEV